MCIRNLAIRNIASPYGMTLASVLLFLVAYTLPPSLYSSYIHEPDLLFLDPASLLFFLLCALGFTLGLALVDLIFPVRSFIKQRKHIRIPPMWFVLFPLVVGISFALISIVVLLRDNAYLIEILLAAEGEQLKSGEGLQMNGSISQASPVLMGIVWWALWRKDEIGLCGWRRFAVHFAIVLGTIAMLVSSTLMLSRGELMPILAGIAILFLLRSLTEGKLTLASIVRFVVIAACLIVALFVSFSMLRGVTDSNVFVGYVMGYTVASYNRLAAMLDGRLRYPFSGRGLYFSAFVSFNNIFNNLFHLNRLFAWPDFNTVWRSEFDAVSAAGLSGGLIWSGTFGYIFSELGWLSPLLLFVHGLATGWAWRSFRLGQTAGIVLYPWCAYCTLFWFGTNYMLDPLAVDLLFVVIILSFYETLCGHVPKEVASI